MPLTPLVASRVIPQRRSSVLRSMKPTAMWISVMVAVALTAWAGRSQAQTGIVNFSQSAYSVNVSQSNALITVLFTGSGDGTGAVNFATSGGTATAGVDYVATNGILVFAVGVLSNTFSVPVLDNGLPGSTQTVNLVLSNPTGFALLGSPSLATLTILNFQTQQVQFAQAAYEVDEGESNAVITLVRTGATNGTISVDFKTSDGSAKAGVDYTATTGTVSFADGVVTNTFSIPILESGALQTNQTIKLTASNPLGAGLGTRTQAVLTILATGPTVMQFSAANYKIHAKTGKATLNVIRFGDSSADAKVDYATSDGTAKNGIDYVGVSGTLDFPAGASSAGFTFQFIKLQGFQSNRTVNATLSTPVGGALGTQATAVVTIVNDQKQSVTFTNGGGDVVTITLQKAGTMDVSQQPAPVDIVLSETDASSALAIKVKKSKVGTGLVQVDAITGDGDCGSINAPTADLTGSGVQLVGYLKQLQVHDVLNGASVTAGGTADQVTTIKAHNIDDAAAVDFGSQIKTLQAARFGDGTITAPSIGSMSIKGDKKAGISGDCEGVITLSGAGVPAGKSTLSKLAVSGAISNANINVANGNVGSIAALTMVDSHVYVGYTPTDPNIPLAGGTFVPSLRLGSLQIKAKVNGLANSFAVAAQIGKIAPTSVQTNNIGVPFGVLANESISAVTVKTPAFKWSPTGATDQSSGDFHVILP